MGETFKPQSLTFKELLGNADAFHKIGSTSDPISGRRRIASTPSNGLSAAWNGRSPARERLRSR